MTTINPTMAFNKGVKEYLKLDVYRELMDAVQSVNLEDPQSSAEFREMYNGYYRIRRDKTWQDKYYSLFEEAKGMEDQLSFDDILFTLYKETGQVEKVFVSKMMATLDPNKPILDSRVISYLNKTGNHIGYSGRIIESKYNRYEDDVTEANKKKLEPAIREYQDLELWYEEYVETDEASEVVKVFDDTFPEFKDSKHFTTVRKIDWYLWMLG